MKYLDCIELLNLALKLLKSGERVQVPVSKLTEIQLIVVRVNSRLETYPNMEIARSMMHDLMLSIGVAQENKAVKFLNDQMKQALVEGIRATKKHIASEAYQYYSNTDFEPTPQNIPLMREVVQLCV